MSRDESRTEPNRRRFLRGLATAGGAAATSGLIVRSAEAAVPTRPTNTDEPAESQGYRLTPHILEYYEKARF